jgi:hypothetical protein
LRFASRVIVAISTRPRTCTSTVMSAVIYVR